MQRKGVAKHSMLGRITTEGGDGGGWNYLRGGGGDGPPLDPSCKEARAAPRPRAPRGRGGGAGKGACASARGARLKFPGRRNRAGQRQELLRARARGLSPDTSNKLVGARRRQYNPPIAIRDAPRIHSKVRCGIPLALVRAPSEFGLFWRCGRADMFTCCFARMPASMAFADGHTASNAPDLFRPPKLSGAGPG